MEKLALCLLFLGSIYIFYVVLKIVENISILIEIVKINSNDFNKCKKEIRRIDIETKVLNQKLDKKI